MSELNESMVVMGPQMLGSRKYDTITIAKRIVANTKWTSKQSLNEECVHVTPALFNNPWEISAVYSLNLECRKIVTSMKLLAS